MASLQARHTRACDSGKPWSPAERLTDVGCSCQPTFYIVVREGRQLHRERAGKNRQQAERALRKIGVQVDDGVFQPQKTIRFEDWATQYVDALEREESTKRSYRHAMGYAKAAFGDKVVRRLSTSDVQQFLTVMRDVGISDSTRAKHLRVLTACLNSAVAHGYAARNVARDLPKGERPRSTKRESAYFTNDELPRLFNAVDGGVYRVLFLTALKTGMRLGELLALKWADVDLVDAVVHVRWSFTDGELKRPKNHEVRDLDVPPEVVDMLGAWWGELGRPDDDRLVFPGETKTGYVNGQVVLRRELYPAMVAAGVKREGPTGEKRTFHSLRHTYAKRALENGRQITWLSRHLGHSSLNVTTETYGHWERAERKREAVAMAGVFGV